MLLTKETLTPEKIAEIKAITPEVVAVHARKGILVFRKPSRGEYDTWSDKAQIGKADSSVSRQLAQSCLAGGCTYDDLMSVVDDQPALLVNEITTAITGLAGLHDEAEVKKL